MVFDSGHCAYGAGMVDVLPALKRFQSRVWYIHFKDCHPLASRARAEQWDYFQAMGHGVFCELGQRAVDFTAVLLGWTTSVTTATSWLSKMCYPEWAHQRKVQRVTRSICTAIENS
jgi:inosose dehydratase